MLFLGIDVGTQAAKAIISTESGEVVAEGRWPIETPAAKMPAGWAIQEPKAWWQAAKEATRRSVGCLGKAGGASREIEAVSIDSTSGTFVPLDRSARPLVPALMYNDVRAGEEAERINSVAEDFRASHGYSFSASFALPKILWMKENLPAVFDNTWKFAHAADYLVGKLTGEFGVSDTSNALKTGYDLLNLRWPDFIEGLGIPLAKMPRVVSPGEFVGAVSKEAARETGLFLGTKVVAGCSDGTAALIASGAAETGTANSNLGTTLVVRAVTDRIIHDPKGRIYCHLHPDGYWLPGGASNTGCEGLDRRFPLSRRRRLEESLTQVAPTSLVVYPLARKGERLPFNNPQARGFIVGEPSSEEELYAAHLEGVAFLEKWTYELLQELGCGRPQAIYVTGGGAESIPWLGVRATVLGQPLLKPEVSESAFGSAILAASKSAYSSLTEACRAMVSIEREVQPDAVNTRRYADRYAAFREECGKRGYDRG